MGDGHPNVGACFLPLWAAPSVHFAFVLHHFKMQIKYLETARHS